MDKILIKKLVNFKPNKEFLEETQLRDDPFK